MDVRILALVKPDDTATALGIRQSQKLASGFAPPNIDVQRSNQDFAFPARRPIPGNV